MKNHLKLLALLFLFSSNCKKQFDEPPVKVLSEGQTLTVSAILSRAPANPSIYKFSGDTSLYCIVTADEISGSFYRKIFVIDDEGSAIVINLLSSGGIYIGDRIRINLDGTSVIHANGSFSLDSVSKEKHIVKVSSGHRVLPKSVTLSQVLASINGPDLQSQFVELNNVEFVYSDRNIQLGDPIGKTKKELTLTDCQSNTITVSVSGFANFASKMSPSANGKIAGMVTRYNNAMELEMRNYSDLMMTGPVCTGSASAVTATFSISSPITELNENFNTASDQVEFSSGGWTNYCEKGKTKWKGNVKAAIYKAGKITAFGSGQAIVSWLISRPITYKSSLKLSFKTGAEYFKTGHAQPIMAYICTNLDGTNMSSANWTPISTAVYITDSDGSYSGAGGLRSSGEIELKNIPLLSGYTGVFFVGFKYQGEPGFDTNIYLDDVIVR
jgi:hypothetical protein